MTLHIKITWKAFAYPRRSTATKHAFLVTENRPHAQVIAEYKPGQLPSASCVYGRDLISQVRDGALSYDHVDGHGSTIAISDIDGNVVERYLYDAFGQLMDPLPGMENVFLDSGEERDFTVNLDYLRARYYAAGTHRGRFGWQPGFKDWFHQER
jgi:hypothetical protein